MSYTFSRRAFFKYSAAAAVAVAGASLLGSCSGQDPNNPKSTKLGGKIVNMQVTGCLDDLDMTTGAFQFSVKSERENPIIFDTGRFAVTVLDDKANAIAFYLSEKLTLSEIVSYTSTKKELPRLNKGDSITAKFTVAGFTAVAAGQTVRIQYIPVVDMPTYSLTWEIKQELDTQE